MAAEEEDGRKRRRRRTRRVRRRGKTELSVDWFAKVEAIYSVDPAATIR